MRFYVALSVLCFAVTAVAQQPASQAPDPQQLVTREFGKSFTVDPKFQPMYGDLDGDGQEDAVIVVSCDTPMAGEVEYKYRTIDPYDTYWGWGNTRDTVRFASTAAGPVRFIAVIHNWRAPKAKFLVINLPFEKVALGHAVYKKKPVISVHALESSGLESDLFWDGKKYKWEPGYINQ